MIAPKRFQIGDLINVRIICEEYAERPEIGIIVGPSAYFDNCLKVFYVDPDLGLKFVDFYPPTRLSFDETDET